MEHTYAESGDYTVSLTVTDDAGATAEATVVIHVITTNQPPDLSSFTANKTVAKNPPVTIKFEASVSDPEGDALTCRLDFGDGASTDALAASHTYREAGTYQAVLTATDSHGNQTSEALTIQVNNERPALPTGVKVTLR